jgi:hypothetical protein
MTKNDVEFLITCIQNTTGGQLLVSRQCPFHSQHFPSYPVSFLPTSAPLHSFKLFIGNSSEICLVSVSASPLHISSVTTPSFPKNSTEPSQSFHVQNQGFSPSLFPSSTSPETFLVF